MQAHDSEYLRHGPALRAAVAEAGELTLDWAGRKNTSWRKDDGSPVSDADLAVDDLLKRRLGGLDPSYGWLSEESRDDHDRLERDCLWVVDPIDGTRAFLAGSPQWSVCAALVRAGRPVLAAVFAPALGEMFTANLGRGAALNGVAITVSRRSELQGSRLIAPSAITRGDLWEQPWPAVERGMTTSLALRLCRVANGDYDGVIAIGAKCDWDLAAGDLIVHEAGGQVTGMAGDVLVYNRRNTRQHGLIAAGPGLHGAMAAHAGGYRKKG